MRTILTIFRKEILDTVRDRRTLMVMIVVPLLLMPALMIGLSRLASSGSRAPAKLVISGGVYAPQIVAQLRADPMLTVTTGGDPIALVKNQKADMGVIIGADFAARLRANQPAPITIVSDESQASSSLGAERIRAALTLYQQAVANQRLRQRGIDPTVLDVVAIKDQNVASKQAMGGLVLSYILPMLLVMWAIIGGMYTAIDVAAGEKERNTLEALLMTPATKLQVTLGKLLAVTTVGFIAMAAAIGSLSFSLERWPITGSSSGAPQVSIPLSTMALMLLIGLLLATAFSALELALSVFARSFKEAQNYITPLYLAAIVPVIAVNALPTLRPPLALFLVPPLNATLVFKEVLLNRLDGLHLALSAISLLLFAALSVVVSTFVFTREKVLFKA